MSADRGGAAVSRDDVEMVRSNSSSPTGVERQGSGTESVRTRNPLSSSLSVRVQGGHEARRRDELSEEEIVALVMMRDPCSVAMRFSPGGCCFQGHGAGRTV